MAIEALKIMEKEKISSFLITDIDNSLIGSPYTAKPFQG